MTDSILERFDQDFLGKKPAVLREVLITRENLELEHLYRSCAWITQSFPTTSDTGTTDNRR